MVPVIAPGFVNMTQTEKLLCELVALPSVNPAFLPPGHAQAGEGRVAEFLAATAASAGLDVAWQKALPGRRNLIARLSPPGKVKQRILLAPHLDTVAAFSEDQFIPRLRRGRIFGRGACDTKGSVAAMLSALMVLAERGARPAGTEFIFTGLVDEELAQGGSRALAGSALRAALAIVGEPTGLRVVTAHKGNVWLRLVTRGKAAHGSCPHLGKNAVHEMARIVDLLQTRYARQLQSRTHALLGTATVSIGSIHGGSQPNIVPAECVATADRRTLPGETELSVIREIKALLRQHGLRASFGNEKSVSCPPLETDHHLPLVQAFLTAARQKAPAGATYFCDAAILAQSGLPSVVFGPGNIAQAHTADEWVSTASLEQATQVLLKFFRSLSS
jgi:acetylornithine deacetylase/succinyl-diaminopimelate desuccinylase-like protein